VWDGHTNSKAATLEKFQTNINFDDQINAIHRAHGLGPSDPGAMGPGMVPGMHGSLPPPPPGLPANPLTGAFTAMGPPGAQVGPPPAFGQPPPMMLPPLHYPPVGAGGPQAYMGMPPQMAGTVRSADEMGGEMQMPPAKRQRIARLPDGQYYPEQDWINLHPAPISLRIQLPSHPEKPEWKLDGTAAIVPDLPVTLLVSTLRDRIIQHLGSSLSAGKMRLAYGGTMLTNANNLASYNLEDEDLVTLSLRDEKKKK